MIRCFIAIDLPADLKEKLAEVQNLLKKTGANVKWVNSENIHLTIKFLGEIPGAKVREVRESLKELTFDKISVSVKNLGVFPNMRRLRVIWAGVDEGVEELKEFSSLVENQLHKIGFEREKRGFKPHLTIDRVRRPENLGKLKEALESVKEFEAGSFVADKFIFMQSELKPSGAVYTPIEVYKMG